jgi:N-acetylmuramoyl-L-alanine amidase
MPAVLVILSVCASVSLGNGTAASAAANIAGMAVFLDPGHNSVIDSSITRQVPNGRGGTKECNTSGTGTNAGYAEHSFNWDVALRIRDALNPMGVRTEMSRDNDGSIGACVDERAALANAMLPMRSSASTQTEGRRQVGAFTSITPVHH